MVEVEGISRELMRDESVLWSGAPGQGVRLQASDALLIPFSIVWGGFAIFWEIAVIAESAPPLFVLWGIPFVLTGLQLMVGRFFTDSFARAGSSYVLTDRRVLIVKTWPRRQVLSIDLRSIGSLTRQWHRDGTMTIALGLPTSSGRKRVEPPKLEWIREGERVHALTFAALYEAGEDEDEDEASR